MKILFVCTGNAARSVLGEGYMKDGNTKLAIKNYEKSLKLNPDNENAEKMLEKLKEKK